MIAQSGKPPATKLDTRCKTCKRSIVSRYGKPMTHNVRECDSCKSDKKRKARRQEYRALKRGANRLGLDL